MARADYSFTPDHSRLAGDDPMPPRSLLCSLEPIGIGTTAGEGLVSYILRLAEGYSINPHRLISDVFCVAKPELASLKRHGTFYASTARSINGLHHYSAEIVEVIETLCQLDSARYLTLLPLKALLPHNGKLLALLPRWCPECHTERGHDQQPLYQPLAWSIDLYQVCVRHGMPLVDRCPACGRPQHVLPRTPLIGYCCHCGAWLGKRNDAPALSDLTFQLWIAGAIEAIVGALPQIAALATRHRFVRQLNRAVQQYTRGSRQKFCQEVGLYAEAFQGVLGGGERPTFSTWLAIAYGLRTDPVQFLRAHYEQGIPHDPLRTMPASLEHRRPPATLAPSRYQSIFDKLVEMANRADPPMSVKTLATEFGVTRSLLRHRWPDLCHRISNNYKGSRKRRAQKLLAEKQRVVLEVMDRLIASGICPTQSLVQSELAQQRVSFADPAIREVFRQRMCGQ